MTDSVIKYVGVDGCAGGWIGVGLSDDDVCPKIEVCKDFSEIVACFEGAYVILVDIPIGLCKDAAPRACDKEARKKLGRKRQSSVFPAPPRPFVNKVAQTPVWDWTTCRGKSYRAAYAEANEWHREKFCGKGVSSQAFGITRKIGEVDNFLRNRNTNSPKIWEVHPEICFWALNDKQPVLTKKKETTGLDERRRIVRRFVHDAETRIRKEVRRRKYTKAKVADDDILDALVAAITARIGCENEFQTLPSRPWNCSIMDICLCGFSDFPPKDSKGLPMEMVYALPTKGHSC